MRFVVLLRQDSTLTSRNQEHWVARRETDGVELVKFGERFGGDISANTEPSLEPLRRSGKV